MALLDRQKELVRHGISLIAVPGPTLMAMSSYLTLSKLAAYKVTMLDLEGQLQIMLRKMIEKELNKPFFEKLFEMKARGYC